MTTITGMTASKITALVAMSPISSQLLAAAAPSVTFSAIPATFKHLKLKVGRLGFAVADYSLIQVNGDVTVGNYFFGSAGAAGAATTPGFPPFKTNAFLFPAGFEMDINNYSSTVLQKSIFSKGAVLGATTEESVNGGWNQTAAVITIKILTSGGQNYPIGSQFDLYGVN